MEQRGRLSLLIQSSFKTKQRKRILPAENGENSTGHRDSESVAVHSRLKRVFQFKTVAETENFNVPAPDRYHCSRQKWFLQSLGPFVKVMKSGEGKT